MARWFGATEKGVLQKILGSKNDPNLVGGNSVIRAQMDKQYEKIMSNMPQRLGDLLDEYVDASTTLPGYITGHIVVASAADGQTAIDINQLIIPNASELFLYKNWLPCSRLPVDNKDTAMVEGTDYTFAGNIIDFSLVPLEKGQNVVANYKCTWVNATGLGFLKELLEEATALELMQSEGMRNNDTLVENLDTRIEAVATDKENLKTGEVVPTGIRNLNLMKDVEVNDTNKTIRTIRVKRG